jgi:hypothetical protein
VPAKGLVDTITPSTSRTPTTNTRPHHALNGAPSLEPASAVAIWARAVRRVDLATPADRVAVGVAALAPGGERLPLVRPVSRPGAWS